jgi:glycerol kinase
MARPWILAVDQGTTNTKAVLLDERAAVIARGVRPVPVTFPKPGWVEQDADQIWRSVVDAVDECLSRTGRARPMALALTNQRESAVVWERATGRPVGPVIVWQCRRTADRVQALAASGVEPLVRARTGLTLDPLFSATKIRWLIDHTPDGPARAAGGDLCAGTIDSWLIWQLTGGATHATDVTNASRTQLLDLASAGWDAELLRIFDVPAAVLPVVQSSSHVFGPVTTIAAIADVPVASVIGDSHAALFGHAAFASGSVKATYGTGSSLMMPRATPAPSPRGLSTTIAWGVGASRQYAHEGNITVTGSGIAWIAGLLPCGGDPACAAELARSVPDTGGAYFVPALAGLGAPHWDAEARGVISGLTRGTTPAHVARAAVEAVAYQVRDVFDAMDADAGRPARLLADGGAAQNDTLMQFQADILGVPVRRDDSEDVSARGAAWLAGLAVGVWRSFDELAALPVVATTFTPRMSDARRDALYAGWQDALGRTRSHRRMEDA